MPKTPTDRKIIAITTQAYSHLLKLREAQAKALNFRLVTLVDVATNAILNTPLPHSNNGHNHTEEVEEDTND